MGYLLHKIIDYSFSNYSYNSKLYRLLTKCMLMLFLYIYNYNRVIKLSFNYFEGNAEYIHYNYV